MRTDDDGKESCQSHRHLENPPKRPLAASKRGIGQELVGSEYHVINLLFQEVNAEIYSGTVIAHIDYSFVYGLVDIRLALPSWEASRQRL